MALKIEAVPLLTSVSPQANKPNGTALFSSPSSSMSRLYRVSGAAGIPAMDSATHSTTAAMATRPSAMVSGGISAPSTLKNRNEQPQGTDSENSVSQSLRVMPPVILTA